MIQRLAEQGVVHAESTSPWASSTCGAITTARLRAHLCRLERARERGQRELAFHSTGSSMPSVTSPSTRQRSSSERPLKCAASSLPSSASGSAATSAARLIALRRTLCQGPRSRPAPHQPRRRNHGPEAIYEALALGSERIGHALSAIQDPALIDELKAAERPSS